MARYLIAKLGAPAVALAAFLFAAPAGLAQHHGGGGHASGGHASGGHASGGHWSGGGGAYRGSGAYRGGYGGYGRGYYGGYGRGYYGGYGRGWYGGYYPWWGLGLGWGYPSYSYGSGYYPYDYGYNSGYGYPDYSYPDYSAPGYYGNYGPNYSTLQAPPAMDNVAQIVVNVPSDAEVWFEGQKMTQSGSVRSFVSPTLPPGKDFVYHVKARWMENGREVEQTRTLDVQAGSRASVNFTAPAPNRS